MCSRGRLLAALCLFLGAPLGVQALSLSRRQALTLPLSTLSSLTLARPSFVLAEETQPQFVRASPIQFIAALGDPEASSGQGAETWGVWRQDPGPRGVRLGNAGKLMESGMAPAGWSYDERSWWLEEHGLIMEQPAPLPAGKYVVTGDRRVTTVLEVARDGSWKLADGKLYDVTHLPCRSALYTSSGSACTPAQANRNDFPVKPGAVMPAVTGCEKQDYAVLFIVGVESRPAAPRTASLRYPDGSSVDGAL